MNLTPPVILDESAKVVEWARNVRKHHYSMTFILQLLLSEKITAKDWKNNEELQEARRIFSKYSPSKDNVILAIMIDTYRKENDFKEGQIVTNGDLVGFPYKIDYKNRLFELHSRKEASESSLFGTFEIDEFRKV